MELDVHLTREGEEAWGFDLVGGADYGIPLTIDKVYPSSPAQTAGLQAGDVIARLGDRLATELALETAVAIVADAVGSLSFGLCRGLYDPVLDDYEPIYEPIDRADSDLRSEPTEVQFPIQQFDPNELSLDDPNILDPTITDPSMFDSGYLTRPLTENRSLTASPFVPNTKPYRPFSTEPSEVPSLEDPIILNPNYKDTFGYKDLEGKVLDPEDELLRLIPLEKDIEAKFKLPVSEKYDPNWNKKVRDMLEKSAEGGNRETEHVEHELVYYEGNAVSNNIQVEERDSKACKEVKIQEKKGVRMSDEVTFEEKMKEDVVMQKIEETALQVVDESIERAVSVTEEIQREVEVELRASATRELQVKETELNSEIKTHIEEIERKESVSKSDFIESVEIMKQETKEEIKISEHDEFLEEKLIKDQQFVKERQLSTEKEMEEAIETGNVKRKSSAFEKEDVVRFSETAERTKLVKQRKDEDVSSKNVTRKAEERKSEHVRAFTSDTLNTDTTQSEGKQKAFMIGLQTIPHIKGFIQSSYHFDLLLRTFFVHLTDVMVALSRFIITQPTAELEGKSEKVIKEKLIQEFTSQDSKHKRKETEQIKQSTQTVRQDKLEEKSENEIRQEKVILNKQEIQEAQQVRHDVKKHNENRVLKETTTKEQTSNKQETRETSLEEVERKKKSGVEMSQMTQRKSKDLTNKMAAVITEFESKTGIEDRLEVTEQSRRSRSRSHIEEEVMKESDPLEWLDKVDSRRASQERTDVRTSTKEFSTFSESKESKKTETKRESRTTKVKPGKQMYVAIVESHVYTNKDAILEDQAAEMSETASVQSSEEINPALESLETISMENVAINDIQTEEKHQAVEVVTKALEEAVQDKLEVLEHVTEQHSKSMIQESHAESTKLISDSKETLKTQEIMETKAVSVQETTYKTAAVNFVDVPLEATKEVIVESAGSNQEAVFKQELLTTVAAESTEIIADLEQSKEEKLELKVTEKQAVVKVESLAIAVAETTDVVEDSKLETFESKEFVSKQAKVATEDTFRTAATESSEVTFEEIQEDHLETAKAGHVTISETQALPVAGIIETKTEVCKELKKPAEDEYASLEIVKEVVIDSSDSVEILTEAEVTIKNSLEVNTSSSQHVQSKISKSNETNQTTIKELSNSVQESYQTTAESSKVHLRLDLAQKTVSEHRMSGPRVENSTPSPIPPPTPLTDEYVFKLEIPLPKNEGMIVVEDSPDREDPHIVKKGLVPHIESVIEDQILYDPPLPTPPPEGRLQSPVYYTKPGLRGGAEPLIKKEYIREIERKSSLLASAIDQTIKSIEEYKEEVGIEMKTQANLHKSVTETEKHEEIRMTNGFHGTESVLNGRGQTDNEESKVKEEWNRVATQVTANSDNVKELNNLKSKVTLNGTEHVTENGIQVVDNQNDALPGFKPVVFNPEAYQAKLYEEVTRGTYETTPKEVKIYVNESGEPLGTTQGIVDGLEDATVNEEIAKELGKPGLTDDKIAELISGESEMLREAHVMGLSRVLNSHMTRDGPSVDFDQIKPLVPSLKDSEVLKALNEDLQREKEEEKKKKEEKKEDKWTTFLQKPKRPVPRARFGYFGYVEPEVEEIEEPYKVVIVKQPKPKVAPDYKPEDFDTGPLPWEERALTEPVPSPTPPEEPILVPEDCPEFLEAVDPLPESEVPDLEDTGIPLPSPPPSPPILPPEPPPEPTPLPSELPSELPPEPPEPEVEPKMHGDQNQMAEQLVNSVRSMVDPNASLEQQLSQMRAQLAALAQLPCVIQQSLETLTRQLSTMSQQDAHRMTNGEHMNVETHQELQIRENTMESIQEYQIEEAVQNNEEGAQNDREAMQKYQEEQNTVTIEEVQEQEKPITAEDCAQQKREEEAMLEEQRRSEKEKKEQQEKVRLEQESRQLKQRAAPRVGKPKPVFGPLAPEERPVVLPGGRRWRGPKDAYNEQLFAETMQAQAEVLQGKVLGINFMKYEKPPVSLDHLQNSATYKLIHNMEQEPLRRVDLLTPVVAEADYRERCRSVTPMQTNGRV